VNFGGGWRSGRIVGVVENFHFESLHQPISPIVVLVTEGRASFVMMDIDPAQKAELHAYLQEQWAYLMPDSSFESFYLGDRFDEQYASEDRLSMVVTFFASLAIIIATLGLIGLASFTTEQRYKEIGIRKILGASLPGLLKLLTRDMALLMLVAIVPAVPITYWLMQQWLSNYAFSIDYSLLIFVLPVLLVLLLGVLTVSLQTLKAARTNPVDSLRYE